MSLKDKATKMAKREGTNLAHIGAYGVGSALLIAGGSTFNFVSG